MRSASGIILTSALALVNAVGCGSAAPSVAAPTPAPTETSTSNLPSFKVTSILVKEGQAMPDLTVMKGFGCNGGNTSPDLAWAGEPQEAKSFAIIGYDPDAPTGVGFFHWVVANIPGGTRMIEAGAGNPKSNKLPPGAVVGFSDIGASEYAGACPPPGAKAHRYQFTVYALDIPHLDATPTTTGAALRFMIREHAIAQGTLTGTYSR